MSIIVRPPSALGFVVIFLVILWGLLSQRKLYKILSRAFNISLDGEGSVDSLLIGIQVEIWLLSPFQIG